MADEDLRRLEQRAALDPAARARLLRERVRAGVLTERQLRLAATLGDAAAAEACGRPALPPPEDDRALLAWLVRVEAFGPAACARVLLAASAVDPERIERDASLVAARADWQRAATEASPEAARSLLEGREGLAEVRRAVWDACYRAYGGPAPEVLSPATWREAAARVVAAVRAAVVPWALGEGDPLATER